MRIFFLLLCSFIQFKCFCTETITFTIFLWGDSIGTVSISKTEREDSSQFYQLESKLKAKVLWIVHENHALMEAVFKNGKLISSYQKETENGETKRWNRVTCADGKCNVDGYKGKRTINEQPVFSVAPLYFYGLSGVTRLFYEAEADFCKVQKMDDNTWEFKSSDGSRNVYHFKNGKIHSIEFHFSIATVKLVRVN